MAEMMYVEHPRKAAAVTDIQEGPERLSTNELVSLIDQIAAGRGSEAFEQIVRTDDPYWPSTYSQPKPALEEIRAQIAREQSEVDEKLRTHEPVFVITAGGTRRVHLPGCFHVRHTLDREEAWSSVLGGYATLRPADFRIVYQVPQILTRREVETLNSYITCQICAPTLDHQRKMFVLNARPVGALGFGPHHIGRAVATPEGEDLGHLVSHQRIVTADGIRSITTTTECVIETDGTEKYAVAPKP